MQFFPKTEKYVSLFMGGDDGEVVEKRNRLRKVIKENILAAAASGKELEGIFFILLLLDNIYLLALWRVSVGERK